jgi:hypothetical protein
MDKCSCVYVGDYEHPEFHRAVTRKAIKEHVCCECNRTIRRGEKYEYVSGMWDAYISNHKTCGDCLSIRDVFYCEGFFYTMLKESLWEHLRDVDGEVSEDCFVELTLGARSVVCDMIEKIWEDVKDGNT